MFNEGRKLKKSEIRQLPRAVADRVLSLQNRYRTRFCKLYLENPGFELYLAEGANYTLVYRGEEMSLQMVSERTMGMSGPKEAYQVGRRVPLPQGTWVIEFELFLGKPIINVSHVGPYQLGKNTSA